MASSLCFRSWILRSQHHVFCSPLKNLAIHVKELACVTEIQPINNFYHRSHRLISFPRSRPVGHLCLHPSRTHGDASYLVGSEFSSNINSDHVQGSLGRSVADVETFDVTWQEKSQLCDSRLHFPTKNQPLIEPERLEMFTTIGVALCLS